jgi:1-deoxy-D-xylulose-5-phosphate reductoisomerase
MSYDEVGKMTRADALRHPNWTMGAKITVDSATLMNKGLEVIEAMRLYRLPLSQVDVVIHRQSIVHSLVEYRDGAVLAQLGTPDTRLPIRYAMTYPKRAENPAEPLDLLRCPPLTFAEPDREVFSCLRLAEEAATEGGTACAILNGANEEAVGLFLAEKIGFNDIARLVAEARTQVKVLQNPTLEDILAADAAARRVVREDCAINDVGEPYEDRFYPGGNSNIRPSDRGA